MVTMFPLSSEDGLIGPHIMGHGGYDHPSNAQQIARLRLTRPSVRHVRIHPWSLSCGDEFG